MKYFFPRRKLTTNELSLVPEGLWKLFIARLIVSLFQSSKYLPSNLHNTIIFPTQEEFKAAQTIAFVINGLSARTPWPSTCLVKVLAAHNMLKKRKIPHLLHFGVKKNTFNQLDAHSWLSVDKEIIIGGDNLDYYKEISQIII